ncbi:integrin beta-PS-like [Schistocerca cancellata]|uniref:integrin beta-PS-like n=1 Tax=Schistocerca cancellata TaxID=274614 RepID=UPI00211838AA|nr:integrin beta-PS-like [Schistocerca cancellata]XP_049775855.1 integrin beta-PS-like [Schistocerca cancellata]
MKLCCNTIILFFIFILNFMEKNVAANDRNKCRSQEDCKSCIRMPHCVWCAVPVTSENLPSYRCEDLNEATDDWCNHKYVKNPLNEQAIPVEHQKPLGKINGSAVQITPQRVELKMRIGETHTVEFHYGVVEDYPVDLYYVMDLSMSMHNHKKRLSELGGALAATMQNITENFRMGFGSFVDKVELPFTSTVESSLKAPCSLADGTKCAPPYSFKNHMSLSNDTEQFSIEVGNAKVSGNLDSPEGGFDAIMQAMVCTKEIGWREKARHLLVYSSDAPFHFAGDGKLAGIVEPHDGRCYMENGEYTHSLVFDYPSVGQINEKAKENNINIIFAVTELQKMIYGNLSQRIQGSSYGILDDKSDSVIKLVRDQYDKLLETVEIIDNSTQYISVKYLTNCLEKNKNVSERNTCGGLKYEPGRSNVTFLANITVKKCPENKANWTQFIEIKPTGVNESLILKIDLLCDCDCEDTQPKGSPDACNNGGRLECGICVCESSRSGKRCECQRNSTAAVDQSDCYSNVTGLLCSGAGICKCGICECKTRKDPSEVIYGKYCECDNYSCKRGANRQLCSGENQGLCVCGSCTCLAGWSGEKCDCSERLDNCIPKGGGPICSDRGKCVCGKCVCDSTSYEGQYCELCPICPGGACNELKECVECEAYTKKDCQNCTIGLTVILQDTVTEDSVQNEENTGFCRFPDENDCTFSFVYRKVKGANMYDVIAEKEKRCSNVNILGVILGVIGSIVFIGLLTLIIWKIVTSIHDEREYSKFEKERAQAKFSRDDNPLYVKATTTHVNPTFHPN